MQNREVHLKGSLEKRLSQAQKEVLCSNYALLLLLAGRSDAARDVSASLMERYLLLSSPMCYFFLACAPELFCCLAFPTLTHDLSPRMAVGL